MGVSLKGKQVLVLGLGKSGTSATPFLSSHGAVVTISDIKNEEKLKETLAQLKGTYAHADLGKPNPKDFSAFDLVVTSPGIREEKVLKALEKCPEKVWTEAELGLAHYPHTVVAITGTNGKTTTGLLLKDILAQLGVSAFFGGNNGDPICTHLLTRGKNTEKVWIVELSSFMLQWLSRVRPHVGVVLNVSSHHISDHGGSFEHYLNAKLNLAKATKDTLVLNALDPHLQQFRQSVTSATLAYFSKRPLTPFLTQKPELKLIHLVSPNTLSLHTGTPKKSFTWDIRSFPLCGLHNVDNVMAALEAAFLVAPEAFEANHKKLDFSKLKAPPYRMELVYDKNKIRIYNDGKSSNVISVIHALRALPGPIHLICGGKDIQQDFHPLVAYVRKKVKSLLLIGQSKERLNRVLGDATETFLLGSLEEAVLLAFQKSRMGDQVLFSPGCPSQDMFRNFEERGSTFNTCVSKLIL